MQSLGSEQCTDDACVVRLVAHSVVSRMVFVHVDDVVSIGRNNICDLFGSGLNQSVLI